MNKLFLILSLLSLSLLHPQESPVLSNNPNVSFKNKQRKVCLKTLEIALAEEGALEHHKEKIESILKNLPIVSDVSKLEYYKKEKKILKEQYKDLLEDLEKSKKYLEKAHFKSWITTEAFMNTKEFFMKIKVNRECLQIQLQEIERRMEEQKTQGSYE
jgi:hypothetical protein